MPKLAWCNKKLKWHSITTSLDYCLCASMPMYLLLTAGQMPWDTTVIIIFVNFAALSECSCIRVLSKLFIYNGAFTTAWFKPGWLISNEIRYADYQFRWNIFCDKMKLDFKNWAGETERGKWNEIISVNLFRVTVWGWYIWCFSSLPARNRSLEKDMSKQIVVKLYSPYTNRCLDQNLFCHRIAI